MKQASATVVILLFFCLLANAQNFRLPASSPSTRLYTYLQKGNAFSFAHNPAALASVQQFSAGIFSEKRFMLKDVGYYNLAVAAPTQSGNFGFKADYFGNSFFNEMEAGFAYARKLGSSVNVGVQFNYYGVNAGAYGSSGAMTAEAGVVINLTQDFRVGLHVYNPTSVKIGKDGEEKLPSMFGFGFGYNVSEVLFLTGTMEKVQHQPAAVTAGLQYNFDKKLLANAGVISSTGVYYLGVGVQQKNFLINVTVSLHPQLGFTPGLLLIYTKVKE